MRSTAFAAAALLVLAAHPAFAAGHAIALAGTVTSAAEGKMEGVVVTAQAMGSPISVSVDSDVNGHYAFPADHLGPGRYAIAIRAVGYDLDGAPMADVAKGRTSTLDLTLDKTKNLANQLTNAEWALSVPGTLDQKKQMMCDGCHTVERIMLSTHDVPEWENTIVRMINYTFQSTPLRPIPRLDTHRTGTPQSYAALATYLASINLSKSDSWPFPLKTLPRPTGPSTRVIITEYHLPRPTIQPHDVLVDRRGTVWYSDFGEEKIGRLDPKTGKVTEYDTPNLRPGHPPGGLDLEFDPKNANDLWLGTMYQAALTEFDTRTHKIVKTLEVPQALQNDATQPTMLGINYPVDGKIWTNNPGNDGILRVDMKTGKWEMMDPLKAMPGNSNALYGIVSDAKNNLFFADFGFKSNYIGRIDAKTLAVTYFPTQTLDSRPRRLEFDRHGMLWFAEFGGNGVGRLDPETGKITEWKMPIPFTDPYAVTTDRNGDIWTGGMANDRIVRIDPKTGQSVAYLMPGDTNVRRVFVDNRTNPVTFWVGANHTATIIKVEPLD